MAELQAQAASAATAARSGGPGSAEASSQAAAAAHEEFWNLPNTITMFRMGVVPILLFLPLAMSPAMSAALAWFFIVVFFPLIGVPLYFMFGGRKSRKTHL